MPAAGKALGLCSSACGVFSHLGEGALSQTGPENPARSLGLLSGWLLCVTSSLFIVPNHLGSGISADALLLLLITNAGLHETRQEMCFSAINPPR